MPLANNPSGRATKAVRKETEKEMIELPKESAPEQVVPVKNVETQ